MSGRHHGCSAPAPHARNATWRQGLRGRDSLSLSGRVHAGLCEGPRSNVGSSSKRGTLRRRGGGEAVGRRRQRLGRGSREPRAAGCAGSWGSGGSALPCGLQGKRALVTPDPRLPASRAGRGLKPRSPWSSVTVASGPATPGRQVWLWRPHASAGQGAGGCDGPFWGRGRGKVAWPGGRGDVAPRGRRCAREVSRRGMRTRDAAPGLGRAGSALACGRPRGDLGDPAVRGPRRLPAPKPTPNCSTGRVCV